MLECESDRDAAAPCTDVNDDRPSALGKKGFGDLDYELGFGSGNQHGRRHDEFATPELLHATNVRDRLSSSAA